MYIHVSYIKNQCGLKVDTKTGSLYTEMLQRNLNFIHYQTIILL